MARHYPVYIACGRKLFGDCVNPMRFAVCVPVEPGPELKRLVLRRDLKTVRDSESRRSWGREFQSLGAATEKALSPKMQSVDVGMDRSRLRWI